METHPLEWSRETWRDAGIFVREPGWLLSQAALAGKLTHRAKPALSSASILVLVLVLDLPHPLFRVRLVAALGVPDDAVEGVVIGFIRLVKCESDGFFRPFERVAFQLRDRRIHLVERN